MSRRANKSRIKNKSISSQMTSPTIETMVIPAMENISITDTSSPVSLTVVDEVPEVKFSSGIISDPVPVQFMKVSELPQDLTTDDIGSMWFCDSDEKIWIWTREGWSKYGGDSGGGEKPETEGAVLYTEVQSLTGSEAARARRNIKSPADPGEGAGSAVIGTGLYAVGDNELGTGSYNRIDTGRKFSVGIGNETSRRSALEILDGGDVYITGVGEWEGTESGFDGKESLQEVLRGHGSAIGDVESSVTDVDTKADTNAKDILTLKSRLDALDDELHPWVLSGPSSSSGTVFEKYTSQTVRFTWRTYITGQAASTVLPEETYWNSEQVSNSPQEQTEVITNGQGVYSYLLRVVRGTKNLSGSVSVRFVMRSYWGIVGAGVNVLDEVGVKALTKNSLRTSRGGTYDGVTLNNEKVAWCYPADFGTLTRILDGNNFDLTDSFTRSEVTFSSGDKYYIYILNKPVTNSGLKFVFS